MFSHVGFDSRGYNEDEELEARELEHLKNLLCMPSLSAMFESKVNDVLIIDNNLIIHDLCISSSIDDVLTETIEQIKEEEKIAINSSRQSLEEVKIEKKILLTDVMQSLDQLKLYLISKGLNLLPELIQLSSGIVSNHISYLKPKSIDSYLK